MRRCDIVWVDLGPVRGSEANKVRPAIVVSNDGANRRAAQLGRGVITVVPVTTNTDRVLPFQVLLPAKRCGLRRTSKAQAEQIRSVAVDRVGDVVGRVPGDLMVKLDDAIRLHLDLT
jgi:mRNA interferase MazF